MRCSLFAVLTAAVIYSAPLRADDANEEVFSGPQVGEKLAPLKVKGVYGDDAGKDFDFVKQADGKPIFLIFVHKLTRPSYRVTKILMDYSAKRKKDGLFSGLVFLFDDATAGEESMKRRQRYMPKGVAIGFSPDGAEGPGSYGLNRKVTLTALVAKDNKVTANFALIQPSDQTDVLKVVTAIVKQVGGKVPTLKELGAVRPKAKKRKKGAPRQKQDPNLRGLLGPVIDKMATAKEVDKAAAELEKYVAKHPVAKLQVGQICRRIIDAGVLKRYGTERAREYLQKWAKEFKPEKKSKGDEPKKKSKTKDRQKR